MEEVGRLNLDYYEQVIIYKSLTNESYLTQIIEHIKPEYFNDKNIKTVFNIIKTFYVKRQSIPTVTELKSYLINDELKDSFKSVVKNFPNIDKNFNDEELTVNTERFLKERAIYNTMLSVAEDVSKGEVNTSYILDSFEKSCNVNLKSDLGLDLFKNIDKVIDDLNIDQPTIPSGWKWLDNKIDGGFLENGRSLYVFAGESNVGKSIFLGNIACNIASQGKTVLVTGGFDPLHSGHLAYFKAARKLGDKLIVGVNSDSWLERKKGKNFLPLSERYEIVSSIKYVDNCILFNDNDDTAIEAIKNVIMLFPFDRIIFANGGDRKQSNVPEQAPGLFDREIIFQYGVGGADKKNSSSWILKKWDNL